MEDNFEKKLMYKHKEYDECVPMKKLFALCPNYCPVYLQAKFISTPAR